MKTKIIIEETIAQEFEVEITDLENGLDEIREMYNSGILVVENPTLIDVQLMICEEGKETDWNSLL